MCLVLGAKAETDLKFGTTLKPWKFGKCLFTFCKKGSHLNCEIIALHPWWAQKPEQKFTRSYRTREQNGNLAAKFEVVIVMCFVIVDGIMDAFH